MVDVGEKRHTERRAVAQAVVTMAPESAAAVARGDAPKGDVISTARIAGIQGGKRTAELIPLRPPGGDARRRARLGTLPTYQNREAFFESIVNGEPDPVELLRRATRTRCAT